MLFNLSKSTINLSKRQLTEAEVSLLDKGLSFIPTVHHFPMAALSDCFSRNLRNLMLRDFFHDSSKPYDPEAFENRFLPRSDWIPPLSRISRSTLQTIDDLRKYVDEVTAPLIFNRLNTSFLKVNFGPSDNLTEAEKSALHSLSMDTSIVIKPADKGGAVVVSDRLSYLTEVHRQLYNSKYYSRIDRSVSNITIDLINSILDEMRSLGTINDKQRLYFQAVLPCTPRAFYILPKVHKAFHKWPSPSMPEGRPIVSDCGSETYRVCELIDFFLKPLATKHLSYVQDTYDFIRKISNRSIPPHAFLVTGDITASYTNMHLVRALRIVENLFSSSPDPRRPDKQIIQLLDICLRYNDFQFADEIFLQILCIAMGKAFAPNLANMYLLEFDNAVFLVSPFSLYFFTASLMILFSFGLARSSNLPNFKHF